jgi:hypothetical protein
LVASAREGVSVGQIVSIASAWDGVQRVRLTIIPATFHVRGRLNDVTGGGINNARMCFFSDLNVDHQGAAMACILVRDSTFDVPVGPGPLNLVADADGYAAHRASIIVSADSELDFNLVPGAAVVGTVRAAGRTVALARVELRSGIDDAEIMSVRTGEDGTYRINGLSPGIYRLLGFHHDEVAVAGVPVVLQLATTVQVDLELRKGRTVEGRVLDGSGAAVPSALVGVARKGRTMPFGTTSGSDGHYRLDGLPAERLVVHADASNRSHATRRVSLEAGDATCDLVLRPPLSLTFRATAAGAPVSAALVDITSFDGASWAERQARTDAGGLATFAEVSAGRFHYSVEHPSGGYASGDVVLDGTGDKSIAVALAASETTVRGDVTWSDGALGAGAFVHYSCPRAGFGQTRAGDRGQFAVKNCGVGRAFFAATHRAVPIADFDSSLTSATQVDITDASPPSPVALRAWRGGHTVDGLVVGSDGGPLADVEVEARSEEAFDRAVRFSDWKGRFRFEDLAPAVYVLRARYGTLPPLDATIDRDASTVSLKFSPESRLSGKLVGPDGGGLISVRVLARSAAGFGETLTLPGGVFLIVGLRDGVYDLYARDEAGDRKVLSGIAVKAGETLRLEPIALGTNRSTPPGQPMRQPR